MAFVLALTYAFTVLSLFAKFPSDEAFVRALAVGAAYVCIYVVVRAMGRAFTRLRRNGRENLPKV